MRATALGVTALGLSLLPLRTGWAAPPTGEDSGPATEAQGAATGEAAQSEDIARARQLADNGRGLFREGSFGAAIEAFEKAYELAADPNLLFNIALCHERLEQWELAIETLDRYRAYALPEEREALESRRRGLEEELAAKREAEQTPAVGPQPTPGPDVREPPGRPIPLFTGAGYALGGIAVVSLATGITLGSVALGRRDASAGDCATVDGSAVCNATGGAVRSQARALAIGADIAYAVSALAATGFVISLAVQARKRSRARKVSVAPGAGPAGGGVVVRGVF